LTSEQSLYALPPDRFIAARDEAVAQARAEGDREAAARLAKLRRPTVAAWLVNLLALNRAEQLGELLDLAGALREAQHGLRGEALRELSSRRREAIAGLVRQVRGLAVEAGRPARETLPLGEVEATLSAALADPDIAEVVRAGRLTKTTEYAGFGEISDESARPQLRVIDGGRGNASAVRDDRAAREERRAAEQAAKAARAEQLRQAREALRLATADEKRAAAEEQEAARAVALLSEQLEALREQHAATEVALREARLRRRSAQREVDRLG
jgi:hypothetical protein